jgi:hypothetical protein
LNGDKARYQRVEGEVFGSGGPRLANIRQGALADCYFLAAVGAVVADDPRAVKNAIRDNGDGTYSVRFYKSNGEAVWIKVDADLPVDASGKLVYAKGLDSDGDGKLELWVPLMEKAYAKFEDKYGPDDGVDGYADIGAGGSPSKAIKALTGRSASRLSVPSSDAKLEGMLSSANDGHQVVASTPRGSSDGWVGNHAYTVVGTYENEAGDVMVTLRNPWGSNEPDASDMGAKANDGLFSVSLDEFRDHVGAVSSNAPRPSLFESIIQLFW